MKLQQLEYVIAIAQAGSITAAAKNLYQRFLLRWNA